MTTLLYQLDTEDVLQVLQVAHEIKSEIGIVPKTIVLHDGRHVLFNKKDFTKLYSKEITLDTYIQNNSVISY